MGVETSRAAIVTGASRGFGLEIARALSADGWAVVMAARHADPLERAAQQLREAGAEVHAQPTDVTSDDDVVRLVEVAHGTYGNIGALVNNAGAPPLLQRLDGDLSWEQWRRNIDADLHGIFHTCNRVAPLMRARRSGAIVNIASGAAVVASPLHLSYTPAQLAIVGFSRCLASDLRGAGVAVHCLCPSLSPDGEVGRSAAQTFAEQASIEVDEWLARSGPAHPLTASGVGQAVTELVGIDEPGVWHVDGEGPARWNLLAAPPVSQPTRATA